MKSSFWEIIRIPFFIGLLLLVLAAGFFFYERLRGGVDLEVRLPQGEVELGVPFEMELALANNSANALKDVKVQIELPDNILLADKPDERIISRGIGDMVNGRVERASFKVVAVPGEHPNYKIKSVVYYIPESISANLQKKVETEVKAQIPEISLDLNVPDHIFSGEELEAKASYRNSLEPKDGNYSLELKINHPPDFEVSNLNPQPKGEENHWRLENTGMREGTVSLEGKIELPDSATFSLTSELVMKILGKEYPIISNTKNITVNPSPLALQVALSSPRETVLPGEELVYLIQYKNNSTVPLEDVVLSAELVGEMFDVVSLETNGAADILAKTLIWSPVQIKELEILEPGEGGQVSFAIKVKENYLPGRQAKDYILKVSARIESPTVPPPLTIERTVNLTTLEAKVVPSSGRE